MIKMTSHIINRIWKLFLFIFLFIALLFVVLTNGIRVESLELPKVKISQLYIKLDKKLILNIGTIDIDTQSKEESSLEEINRLITKLPYIHEFFKLISVQNIIFNNNTIHFLYKSDMFHIDSDFLTIDTHVKALKDSTIELDIKRMILKDFEVEVKGILQANLKEELFNFKGDFSIFNIDGEAELRVYNRELFYRLNTQTFNTLEPFMDFIVTKVDIQPLAADWIYKRIVAKQYKLNNLEGKFNLDTLEFYPYLMRGGASVKNAVVKFDKKAPSALVSKLDIILKNNQLIFDTKKAEYQGKDITNTKIHIYNLMTKGSGIILDINADTMLDDSIHAILHAFNIEIPITQTSGTTTANVKLNIQFYPLGVIHHSGSFKVTDADINLVGVPMHSKTGFIELDNSMIYLKNVNLKYGNIFDIDTSGDFNLTTRIYKSSNKINSLHVGLDELTLLDIEDFNTTATMQTDDNRTTIYIDGLKTELKFLSNNNIISAEKLNLIYPHSPFMKDIGIKNGTLKIDTLDFQNYEIVANLKNLNLPLRENGNKVEELDLKIEINEEIVEAISSDKKIKFTNLGGKKLTIENIDIAFDFSKQQESADMDQMAFIGINSNIIDTNSTFKVLSHHFSYLVDGENSFFNSKFFSQNISLSRTKNRLSLEGQNLTSMFINTLFTKKIFDGGIFELHADGKNSRDLNGTFKINNSTIKGIIFYNNLMAFIQTIPSLITFQNPGFNEDGFKVTSGFVDFSKDKDTLIINRLKMKGESADVAGSGTINLKTKKLDINLQIGVLKNLTRIVDAIPIANYILLGEDGKMYTNIKVSGTLEDPKMKTYAIQDTFLTPLEIIKRALETPIKILQ